LAAEFPAGGNFGTLGQRHSFEAQNPRTTIVLTGVPETTGFGTPPKIIERGITGEIIKC